MRFYIFRWLAPPKLINQQIPSNLIQPRLKCAPITTKQLDFIHRFQERLAGEVFGQFLLERAEIEKPINFLCVTIV